ncbi:MarR family winged helix-turn-helix transcriptional regulator [Kitasatospora sp. GAS204B]|uniref:MarR family winged helix-turn-helix transcriptional regulator n=1 Tax=unclassified Kitasatospora TaxID=2633591 RepID=UPI002472F8E5|nr:MarR family transcriptional regulator [Kitasatospora sp. GAS204B]MDH6116028.1 DNA-binding MarR family transcriptional regulator [Kitasatospora sp. GAS204B]
MTSAPPPAPASLQLAADLRATLGELVRHVRQESALPQNQAGALGWLVREGPHTTAELADRQRVRHQSMARTVTLLLQAGLIRQERHPTDGRKLVLTATEAGRATLQDQRRRRENQLAEAIERELTEAERLTLAQAVDLLRRIS